MQRLTLTAWPGDCVATHLTEITSTWGQVDNYFYAVCTTEAPHDRCECGMYEIEWSPRPLGWGGIPHAQS
jgi:hypothetical protein